MPFASNKGIQVFFNYNYNNLNKAETEDDLTFVWFTN